MGAVPLISTDLASAELIKYAANAFLSLKISYINEIGLLAERVGADISHVARGMGLDARIGTRFLQAGLGWGGSCFGKDTAALVATASEYGLDMQIVRSARDVNHRQRERVVDKLLGELKILKGRTIGLLGLAFKPDTDDLREAPALDVAKKLIERGARVKAHDPVAMEIFKRNYPDSGRDVVRYGRRGCSRRGCGCPGHGVAGISRIGLGGFGSADAKQGRFGWPQHPGSCQDPAGGHQVPQHRGLIPAVSSSGPRAARAIMVVGGLPASSIARGAAGWPGWTALRWIWQGSSSRGSITSQF